jgi:hypothetical protein
MDQSAPSISRGDSNNVYTLRNDQVDESLPKNFDKPLTCLLWHQTGRCDATSVISIMPMRITTLATMQLGLFMWHAVRESPYIRFIIAYSDPATGTVAVARKNARILNAPAAMLQSRLSIAELHHQAARLAVWDQELMRREAVRGNQEARV